LSSAIDRVVWTSVVRLAKRFANRGLIAPLQRAGRAGNGGNVSAGDPEKFPDETSRRPIRHGDLAAGAANPEELSRNDVWTRREHGSKHADNEIESAGLIRERLGVTFLEVDVHPFPIGARAGLVEQVWRNVDSCDLRACSRRRYGEITRPACDIEHSCV
jgi:hypothetical protein